MGGARLGAGLIMAGYLVVEIFSINSKLGDVLPTSLAVQLFYFVLGLALIGLAGFMIKCSRSSRFSETTVEGVRALT